MAPIETDKDTDRLCWHCHQPAGGSPFCPHCETILPLPPKADYFTILGLDVKRLNLDLERLEEAFYALSRRFHPDRYQNRSPMELRVAEERSAHLNVAYRTLRDPFARTEYLLSLEEGGAPKEAQARPPVGLLLEMMGLQEKVEAYRSAGAADRGALEEALREAHRSLEARREAAEAELREAFDLWDRRVVDEGSQEAKAHLLEHFGTILSHRRYLTTTVRDVAAALAGEPTFGREGG